MRTVVLDASRACRRRLGPPFPDHPRCFCVVARVPGEEVHLGTASGSLSFPSRISSVSDTDRRFGCAAPVTSLPALALVTVAQSPSELVNRPGLVEVASRSGGCLQGEGCWPWWLSDEDGPVEVDHDKGRS